MFHKTSHAVSDILMLRIEELKRDYGDNILHLKQDKTLQREAKLLTSSSSNCFTIIHNYLFCVYETLPISVMQCIINLNYCRNLETHFRLFLWEWWLTETTLLSASCVWWKHKLVDIVLKAAIITAITKLSKAFIKWTQSWSIPSALCPHQPRHVGITFAC